MKILFLTLAKFNSLEDRNIYTDLLREFHKKGHKIYIISPVEQCENEDTRMIYEEKGVILRLRIGNIQKNKVFEKGISTITLERRYVKAIKKYFSEVKFDLVLCTTPPITLQKPVRYIKERDKAITYLLLKDIFPQNALDLEMLSMCGWRSIVYRYFRGKENKLYQVSDYIGCMSRANVDYILNHNTYLNTNKVHVLPNCIEPHSKEINSEEKLLVRKKYRLPVQATIFILGGNIGKPQGIPFFIECLKDNINMEDRFFVICGTGTELPKLQKFINKERPSNVLVLPGLPKAEYEKLESACNVGLIFLDYRFTIPNFPSRLLSYMDKAMPIIACTDSSTDIGSMVKEQKFGWSCKSNTVAEFTKAISEACGKSLMQMSKNSKEYLLKNYTAERGCDIILEKTEGMYRIKMNGEKN